LQVAVLLDDGTAVTFKPWNQTISTSLVYRFNWVALRSS
jgi:outer membrane immunogenic protein